MRTFKVITLAMMGLFLVNCDNSKPTVNNIKEQVQQTSSMVSDKVAELYEQTKSATQDALNNLKDGNYSLAQDAIIKGLNLRLPLDVDQNLTLVDVTKGNDIISYKYDLKGITKEGFQVESNQKNILNGLRALYCSKDATTNAIKLVFPNGASHNYYLNGEKVLTLDLKPGDCDSK
ncbi:hypothetical protein GAPWK_1924 [Gilliamella apicola]|uniref:hypothetical protein n=1 Tax=Gilliamella apicola TaxID=1196095 RepID=UPI00042F3233|nr:hypothetical protein [Gilliamella apicola]AHN26497.1 hypothetical protein GAPWK_1924 [Gilliamella apicola]PXV97430.1 hypothetical protein C7392_101370 [Gilliamella apicola]